MYHKNKCLIISVMLSDVNLHYLTLPARCPVSGCWRLLVTTVERFYVAQMKTEYLEVNAVTRFHTPCTTSSDYVRICIVSEILQDSK